MTFLDLPVELRDDILAYLLPAEQLIKYQCPFGLEDGADLHTSPYCGFGPGWSCLREASRNLLSIMGTNQQLQAECFDLLYRRDYQLDLSPKGVFLLNSRDYKTLQEFPFHLVKSLTVVWEVTPESLHLWQTIFRSERPLRCLRLQLFLPNAYDLENLKPSLERLEETSTSCKNIQVDLYDNGTFLQRRIGGKGWANDCIKVIRNAPRV